jgi:homoserine dehydrogenase
VASAVTVESGRGLDGAETPSAGDSFDVIRRLAASDAPLKVMVETTTLDIHAGQPAIDHVRAAAQAGCHAVTANKGPAAFAYEELSALACDRGVSFLFEGAVMDGVPIFNLVRETLPAVEVTGADRESLVPDTTGAVYVGTEAVLHRSTACGGRIAESDPSLTWTAGMPRRRRRRWRTC